MPILPVKAKPMRGGQSAQERNTMKTKSGRSHFASEFRTYDSSGNLSYENIDFRFTALNAEDYMARKAKRFESFGYTVEFKNVVNLDKEER